LNIGRYTEKGKSLLLLIVCLILFSYWALAKKASAFIMGKIPRKEVKNDGKK